MKTRTLFTLAVALLLLSGCTAARKQPSSATQDHSGGQFAGDSSATSIDWPGIYRGTLPCADCEGIVTTITLNPDHTYVMSTVYKGKGYKICEHTGKFSWDESGSTIRLGGISGAPDRYLVGENKLIQLDMEGNRITGALADNYVLAKEEKGNPGTGITGIRWKLVELNGKKVEDDPETGKACFMLLDQQENRVSGYAGCNSFFGSFELKNGGRIAFSNLGSTMMACPDLAAEQEFFSVLEIVDNFTSDGKTLQLNKARMAPLARFQQMSE